MTIQEMQSYLVMSILVNAAFFAIILILGFRLKKMKNELSQEVFTMKEKSVNGVVADFNYCFQILMNDIQENIQDRKEFVEFCKLRGKYNHFFEKHRHDLSILINEGTIFSRLLQFFCGGSNVEKVSSMSEKIEEMLAVLSQAPIDFKVNNIEQLKELSAQCERKEREWRILTKKLEPVAKQEPI